MVRLSKTLGEASTRLDGLTLGRGLEITGASGGTACRIVAPGGSFTLKIADLAGWFNFFNLGNYIRFTGSLSTSGGAINATALLYGFDTWPTSDQRTRVIFTRASADAALEISPEVWQGTFWSRGGGGSFASGSRNAFDVYMWQPGRLVPFQCSTNGGTPDSMHEYPESDIINGSLNLRIDNAGASAICFFCACEGQYTNADTLTPTPAQLKTFKGTLT